MSYLNHQCDDHSACEICWRHNLRVEMLREKKSKERLNSMYLGIKITISMVMIAGVFAGFVHMLDIAFGREQKMQCYDMQQFAGQNPQLLYSETAEGKCGIEMK